MTIESLVVNTDPAAYSATQSSSSWISLNPPDELFSEEIGNYLLNLLSQYNNNLICTFGLF